MLIIFFPFTQYILPNDPSPICFIVLKSSGLKFSSGSSPSSELLLLLFLMANFSLFNDPSLKLFFSV